MINKEERIVVRRFFTFSGVASPALGQIDIRTINQYLRHLGSIVYRYAKSGYFAEPAQDSNSNTFKLAKTPLQT